jgi:uncharacterized protein (UPF0262 family)
MANVSPELLGRIAPALQRATEISTGRYALELSLEQRPERVLTELTAAGATLISLNPMRDTLEDFFMKRVAEMGAGARAPLAEEAARAGN